MINKSNNSIILIIDDNAENLRVTMKSLKKAGFETAIARSGAAGVKRAKQLRPDLILLDVLMPEMDGFETCLRLKDLPETQDIPIIFMTALDKTEDKVRAFECGGVDYITKPFALQEALARVQAHITIQALQRSVAQERDRFRRLSEATDEGLCIHDNGQVLEVNHAMERLTGYARSELIGRQVADMFIPEFHHHISDVSSLESLRPREVQGYSKNGAVVLFEIQEKPIQWEDQPRRMLAIRDISLRKRLENENITLKASLNRADRFGEIVGRSPGMKKVYEYICKVAASDETVVIYGETGTGKELAARTIFQLGSHYSKSFVPVNCAAILEDLFESLFFGHVKGAFTGAGADAPGFIDQAKGGVLFLDEIGELPLSMQARLLRVLQDGEYTPVGLAQSRKADFRIVAATNQDLRLMLAEGRMREDFFHRIHVVTLELPPLRFRREDIPLLTAHFLASRSDAPASLPQHVMDAFMDHDWPGNVRELFNEIRRYLAVGEIQIGQGDVNGPDTETNFKVCDNITLKDAVRAFEKDYIARTLDRCNGNKKYAAKILGVDRKTIYNKINNKF